MNEMTMEELCESLRVQIEALKADVADLHDHHSFNYDSENLVGANTPKNQHANMHANITLVFRHLEDARMRVGKIMQANQGGVSILDEDATDRATDEG